MAPMVMGAFDLYQRRREAKEDLKGDARTSTSPEALRARIQELESADVEQARLISELTNTVEALASSLQTEIEDGRRRAARLQFVVWTSLGLSVVSLGISLWLALR